MKNLSKIENDIMPIYEISDNQLSAIPPTNFQAEGLRERQDIQQLLKQDISVICPDTLLIAEEFGDFDLSNRRIDLLAIDKEANLVVIEIKRTEDGGHMELQSIRYASMVANMTWDQAVEAYKKYLSDNDLDKDPSRNLLEFLNWEAPQEDDFAQNVRIVLASANFSIELTTSILWLNDHDLDISCVRMIPHRIEDHLLLDIEQIIPIIETLNYQVSVRKKKREERRSRANTRDRSLIAIFWEDKQIGEPFRKADIGLKTIQLLDHKNMINGTNFETLRQDRSCSHDLLKKRIEVTEREKKYSKYRINLIPELTFFGEEYYVARNWGITNIQIFMDNMTNKFPALKYEIQ